MDHLAFSIILFAGSIVAGLFGALSGLGGGIVIVPLLVIAFNVDTHYAIGASLIAVIATSTGASVAFLKKGFTNIRAGLLLETATCSGAVVGALLTTVVSDSLIHIIFGVVLIYSTISSYLHKTNGISEDIKPDRLSLFFHLDGNVPTKEGLVPYRVRHVPIGWTLMLIAGVLSGMLGIGSGAMNVLALDHAMKLPFRVSTTTSNFIIGATAAASAGTFLHMGYISPPLVMPLVPGILVGSYLGAKLLIRTKTAVLKHIFSVLILIIAFRMIYGGIFH